MTIIDTLSNTQSKIPCLLSKGVRTVIRYYNFSNSLRLPEKRMELAEAQALGANGLKIAVTFQQRQNEVEDFTELKGYSAGRHAYRYAHDHIGQPAGSGIYFSVDFDADISALSTNVEPYFKGVKRAFDEESEGKPQYRIGTYGSGLVCSSLSDSGLIELKWLAMSRGFQGTKEALQSGNYHLTQRAPEAILCGLDVDFNDANPAYPDFGEFTIEGDISHNDSSTNPGEQYKVIARTELRLREGVGTQFDIIGGLHPGQSVFVVSLSNGWARIDADGDGQIDGFASIDFLERIQKLL
jgi:hypothetical protein